MSGEQTNTARQALALLDAMTLDEVQELTHAERYRLRELAYHWQQFAQEETA